MNNDTDPINTQPIPPTQPLVPEAPTQKANVLAILSLVTGVLAFLTGFIFLGIIFGVAAIILGLLSRKKPGGKAFMIAGLVTGGIGALSGIIFTVILLAGMANGTLLTGLRVDEYVDPNAETNKALIESKKDFAKGEVARFADLEVTVNAVNDNLTVKQPVRSDYTDAFAYSLDATQASPNGKRYVLVDLTVKNVGKETLSEGFAYSSGLIELKADDTDAELPYNDIVEYKPLRAILNPDMAVLETEELKAGASVTGKYLFQIPTSSKELKLQYETSVTNPETKNPTTLRYTLSL